MDRPHCLNNGDSNGYSNNLVLKPSPAIKNHSDEFSTSPASNDSIIDGSLFALSRSRCDSMTVDDDNESKVLVIYTGGTIGMIRNDDDGTYTTCENVHFNTYNLTYNLASLCVQRRNKN